jgi:hypothetical protein
MILESRPIEIAYKFLDRIITLNVATITMSADGRKNMLYKEFLLGYWSDSLEN